MNKLRFSEYLKEISLQQKKISYSHLMPKVSKDDTGQEIPYVPVKLDLKAMDIYRLLQPYVGVRFMEQVKAVAPLAVYMALFQWLVLNQTVQNSITISLDF